MFQNQNQTKHLKSKAEHNSLPLGLVFIASLTAIMVCLIFHTGEIM